MSTTLKMLQDLIRIQQAFHNNADIHFEVYEENGGFYVQVVSDSQDVTEQINLLKNQHGSYPVHIGDNFEDGREWILEAFSAAV